MSNPTTSSVNSSKLRIRSGDLWQAWILAGYGIFMAILVLIGLLMKRSASEIGTMSSQALMTGWFLLVSFHFGQQVRIARLEKRLADWESPPRP